MADTWDEDPDVEVGDKSPPFIGLPDMADDEAVLNYITSAGENEDRADPSEVQP